MWPAILFFLMEEAKPFTVQKYCWQFLVASFLGKRAALGLHI
jgi:hypothetical protein